MAFVKNTVAATVTQDERKQPRNFEDLVAQLHDANPVARRWAARDLSYFPEASAALVGRLRLEQEPSVRGVIFTTLTRLGGPVAVAGLTACLRTDDAALRNEAIEAMKSLPDEMAPIVQKLLVDPDSDVRIFAVNILEALNHPATESWLIDVIDRDSQVNVCSAALDLLAEVGTRASVESVTRLKNHFGGEPYIQFSAALVLKRLGQD